MIQKITPGFAAIGLLGLFAACHSVSAATVSYSTTTNEDNGIAQVATDWSFALDFPQFNPALGTLVSVELDLSGSLSSKITLTNSAGIGSNGNAKTQVDYTVQDSGNMLQPESPGGPPTYLPQLTIISDNFDFNVDAGGEATSDFLSGSGTSSNMYKSAPIRAEFTGAGSITLNASTFTRPIVAINVGGNTEGAQTTSAGLTGSVIYTYKPAPEPGTLVLLCLGTVCGAVGAYSRRRVTHRRGR